MAVHTSEKRLIMRAFSASVRQARFMRAVREVVRACFDHLAEIAKHKQLPPLDESTLELELPLVREWQERWNLTDGWCRDFALAVLYDWRDDPGLLKARALPDQSLLTIDPLTVPDYSLVPRPEWPARAWDMPKGKQKELLDSLNDQYQAFCKNEKAYVDETWGPEPANLCGERYEWLALYQCAGMSARAIAERHNELKIEALTRQHNAQRDAALAQLSSWGEARAAVDRFDEERDKVVEKAEKRDAKYVTDAITRYADHIELTLRPGRRGRKTTH